MAFSMSRINSSWPSGAQVTDFFFLPSLVRPAATGGVAAAVGGGVETTGDSFRAFAIDLRASWKGSIADGCAMLTSGSDLTTAVGAFLKLGSFGFGFGAEKKDESDLASLTAARTTGLGSFFTAGLDDDVGVARAAFLTGGGAFRGGSFNFRFLLFESGESQKK